MLKMSDRVSVTTAFLANRVRRLHKDVIVIPNTLNQQQITLANELVTNERSKGESVVIGYFSGSPTHQNDFAVCEGELLRILEEHPDARLLIVGFLNMDDRRWGKFAGQIERLEFMEPLMMLRKLADVDINIVPLEQDNPFCEGKSQLKIFEAGVVEVPTVATWTRSNESAINSNIDGVLVHNTEEEWYRALSQLIADATARRALGVASRSRALAQFGPEALWTAVAENYGL